VNAIEFPVSDKHRAYEWSDDPKHLGFVLARYKFVAKMLAGFAQVLEVGAGDGWASEVVRREVGKLVLCDAMPAGPGVTEHDAVTTSPAETFGRVFDGIYALDVIEHIQSASTEQFLGNLQASIRSGGVLIIGSPSLESQPYASRLSREHHINCMTAECLRNEVRKFFSPVFMFGMNDEVLHTGFDRMRHYNFAVGVRRD
jgi:2-polyprenyl-3-methyl-5-hydroxy-6-metoxy-1,4-benzoquinol methylase